MLNRKKYKESAIKTITLFKTLHLTVESIHLIIEEKLEIIKEKKT
jgi:hypothetical protein